MVPYQALTGTTEIDQKFSSKVDCSDKTAKWPQPTQFNSLPIHQRSLNRSFHDFFFLYAPVDLILVWATKFACSIRPPNSLHRIPPIIQPTLWKPFQSPYVQHVTKISESWLSWRRTSGQNMAFFSMFWMQSDVVSLETFQFSGQPIFRIFSA